MSSRKNRREYIHTHTHIILHMHCHKLTVDHWHKYRKTSILYFCGNHLKMLSNAGKRKSQKTLFLRVFVQDQTRSCFALWSPIFWDVMMCSTALTFWKHLLTTLLMQKCLLSNRHDLLYLTGMPVQVQCQLPYQQGVSSVGYIFMIWKIAIKSYVSDLMPNKLYQHGLPSVGYLHTFLPHIQDASKWRSHNTRRNTPQGLKYYTSNWNERLGKTTKNIQVWTDRIHDGKHTQYPNIQ